MKIQSFVNEIDKRHRPDIAKKEGQIDKFITEDMDYFIHKPTDVSELPIYNLQRKCKHGLLKKAPTSRKKKTYISITIFFSSSLFSPSSLL